MYKQILNQLKQFKRLRFEIRSVWLFRVIVLMGLTPYVLSLIAWGWSMLTGRHDPWVIPMIDSCLRISGQIFAPAAVTAALNLVPRVKDNDDDGVPDVDQEGQNKEEVKPNEKSNAGRHPDDG